MVYGQLVKNVNAIQTTDTDHDTKIYKIVDHDHHNKYITT